jgi:hypothetical protein
MISVRGELAGTDFAVAAGGLMTGWLGEGRNIVLRVAAMVFQARSESERGASAAQASRKAICHLDGRCEQKKGSVAAGVSLQGVCRTD